MNSLIKRAGRALALMAGLCVAASASAQVSVGQPGPLFSNVYVFGDSLSDGGAGIALLDAACRDKAVAVYVCGHQRNSVRFGTQFYQGRSVSDGPTAVDVLARHLLGRTLNPGYHVALIPGVDRPGENYAVSGAHAHGSGFNVMFSLNGQVAAFERHHAQADPNALYVVFIGANDVLSAIDAQDPSGVDRAISEIQRGLDRLAARGARQFLVFKLLDLADVPRYIARPELQPVASEYTDRFNAGIAALTAQTGTLHRFDLQAFWNFTKQLAYASRTDYKQACVSPVSDKLATLPQDSAADITISPAYLPNCPAGQQRGQRVFFDDLHPSGLMHQYLGIAIFDDLVERTTGRCALHAWSGEASADRGEPNVRRGLPGSIYRYDNPYTGQREYLRLTNPGSDLAYWYFPTNQQDNAWWEYLGTQPPAATACASRFRASVNTWDARLPGGGVATGDFTRAQKGDVFLYNNPYLGKVEYFRFRDSDGSGAYWYFPTDGVNSNAWWDRASFE